MKLLQDQDLAVMLGMTEQQSFEFCGNHWMRRRIISRDGNAMVIRRDIRQDRVNLEVSNGIIISAFIG